MLGVHLSTLQRWHRRTMAPNPDHVVKINHLLGQLDQGQLFFNAPKMSQQEATARFGAPPIPGLLISSASSKADEFRLRQYATLIEPNEANTACAFHIGAEDLVANSFTVYGAHTAQPAPAQDACVNIASSTISPGWLFGCMGFLAPTLVNPDSSLARLPPPWNL